MKEFLLRISIFSIFWFGFIIESGSRSLLPAILFICALTIGSYFFLAVIKKPLLLYIGISLLIFFSYILNSNDENLYTALLLLYIHIESIYQLKTIHFRIFTAFHFILFLFIVISNNAQLEWLMFFSLVYFIALSLNNMVHNRKEQRNMYEELLGEFRKLKRASYETDRTARLEERTRIARDMHDSVGHKLTALQMQIEILSMQKTELDVSELKKLARESLEETRHAVKALKVEESEGIATVLNLIRKLESESHVFVQFTTKQRVLSAKLSNKQSVALYRVIQEALTNAMRHAHSKEIHVILGRSATGDLTFKISNRIHQQKPLQLGFGLSSMKERINELGGTVSIYQTENEFIISGTLPLKEKDRSC
ncbi:sensor histidine kinase [Bacillus aquiflavi]|uniref:sensor histidine kinase n=1 Tax=Bacillus aquiflavi TaxID=2672567 RepID=UPI001CA9583E|nr:sensor histidine kinase [Bacillus aquiflavi]UAC49615.1 sensor histidine kinase [Bacillus aquiflavi]